MSSGKNNNVCDLCDTIIKEMENEVKNINLLSIQNGLSDNDFNPYKNVYLIGEIKSESKYEYPYNKLDTIQISGPIIEEEIFADFISRLTQYFYVYNKPNDFYLYTNPIQFVEECLELITIEDGIIIKASMALQYNRERVISFYYLIDLNDEMFTLRYIGNNLENPNYSSFENREDLNKYVTLVPNLSDSINNIIYALDTMYNYPQSDLYITNKGKQSESFLRYPISEDELEKAIENDQYVAPEVDIHYNKNLPMMFKDIMPSNQINISKIFDILNIEDVYNTLRQVIALEHPKGNQCFYNIDKLSELAYRFTINYQTITDHIGMEKCPKALHNKYLCFRLETLSCNLTNQLRTLFYLESGSSDLICL